MCGRTACTLDPHQLRQACTYTNRQGQRRQPRWRTHDKGDKGSNDQGAKQRSYYPSYNTAPQAVTPVLVSSQHFEEVEPEGDSSADDRLLTSMKWGLVPSWHKGDPNAIAYKMNNCRSEGMMQKASFKRPFERGQRCVVLADGYYEWHTGANKKKQPYFIYFKQEKPVTELTLPDSSEFDYNGCSKEDEEKVLGEWTGHRLLTMAGIFDRWNPPEGGDPLYSYSIITIEADPSVSWIHHRMPVMLDGDEAVRDWLDFGNVPSSKALSMMKALDCLSCHPVTPQMGNTRYKEPDCVKQFDPEEKKKPANTFMSSWLKTKSGEQKPSVDSKTIPTKREGKEWVKTEKKTGLTSWLQRANKPGTLKRAMESSSPEKKAKIVKTEVI